MNWEGWQRVAEAGNIKAGLKILEKENIDVILCDVKLPDVCVNSLKTDF